MLFFLALACGPKTPPVAAGLALPARPVAPATDVEITADGVAWALPGDLEYQRQLYPPFGYVSAEARAKYGIASQADVVRHFTEQSLQQDQLAFTRVEVVELPVGFYVGVTTTDKDGVSAFAARHVQFLDDAHGGLALWGSAVCKTIGGCWNPMAGYPVNTNASDGASKWNPYLPLGMGLLNHRSLLLMHYPPWVSLQEVDYLDNMTLDRWVRLLGATGIPSDQASFYKTVLDVNPIAAPGSGESEYNNDYFPIMLASTYFSNESLGATYIPSMISLLTQPPSTQGASQTLPLLVGGSPLYDPQAPAWFRVAFKEQLQPDPSAIVPMEVLQTGLVTIQPGAKPTPYMGTNHMIAAGVTGTCTTDPTQIPDMRQYEAQDLVAACWVNAYHTSPDADPTTVRDGCCAKYYVQTPGQPTVCSGTPVASEDICWLAEIDLFFDDVKIAPKCSEAQAKAWCTTRAVGFDPCPSDWQTNNCTTVP
ncbi:MAG: hypothetical protein H6734_15645 [Alphaproteobacteria bacterium]|nr:hypothetical protein [Alphaproteobacteria bacterium]